MALDNKSCKWAYMYKAKIVNWVDADTVDLEVDLGFRMKFTERFRLHGINAWEVRGEERAKGLIAEQFCVDKAPIGTLITVQTIRDKKGKYGRYLAKLTVNGEDIGAELVKHGHAVLVDY